MLKNSSPRFSLYSFFSVLLPGIVFILGVLPFLPSKTSINNLGAILPILAIGFAIGQGVHTIAVAIENSSSKTEEIKSKREDSNSCRGKFKLWFRQWFLTEPLKQLFGTQYFEDTSHRRKFINELDPESEHSITDTNLCSDFYNISKDTFPELSLPSDREDLFGDGNTETDEKLEMLYGNVRSVVHIDGRGRSRSFQAIYSFCRSMWIVSICLFLVYALYSMLSVLNVLGGLASYTSFVGTLNINSIVLASSATITAVGSFKLFKSAKQSYQKHYVQYLFTDFLILQNENISSGQQLELSHKIDTSDFD